MPPFFQVEHLTYIPAGTAGVPTRPILRDVSLEIAAGDYVAIIGANGSGKTTLARHLNALLLPTQGAVRVEGLDTRQSSNRVSIQSRVGMAFQDPQDQIVATLVEEDVAFGPENLGLPPDEIRRRVDDALLKVGMSEHRLRPPHLLSAGQMQRVALAGVLALQPRCVIFDESTAMLDPRGRLAALEMMDNLHNEGLTILHITHSMEEAVRAQRVIALSKGEIVLDGSPAAIFEDGPRLERLGLEQPAAVQAAHALRTYLPGLPEGLLTPAALIDAIPNYSGAYYPADQPVDVPEDIRPRLIEVSGLSHVYLKGTPLAHRALAHANLTAVSGASHGLIGPTGSGKSTLLQHLNGLLRPQEGSVKVGEFDFSSPGVDVKAARRRIGLSFQNPENQFFEQYVGDEIAYGPRMVFPGEELRERVRHAMQIVGLDFEEYKDRLTFSLSGGERRKVALASILALEPQILVLDEPGAGLDPAGRRELITHLRGLQGQGLTLVLSSHHLDDLPTLLENLTVMQDGRDTRSGPVEDVLSSTEAIRSCGLEPPTAVVIADGLRQKGWSLPAQIVDLASLTVAVAVCAKGVVS